MSREWPRRLALVTLAAVVLSVALGTVAAAQSSEMPPDRTQQVGITLTEFGGNLTVDGQVGGDGTAVVGAVEAVCQFAGNATVVLGGRNVALAALFHASFESGVGDVFGTATPGVRATARVDGMAWTFAVGRDEAPSSDAAVQVVNQTAVLFPRDAFSEGIERSLVPMSTVDGARPAQVLAGDWFEVSFWDLYGFFVNLLLGIVLVGAFPTFSNRVLREVSRAPARTGLFGLGLLVLTPVVLLLFALSLFGLPLAIVGGVFFLVATWVGAVYGRFVVGAWLLRGVPRGLSAVGVEASRVENRWAFLFVGALAVALLLRVPYLGALVDLVVSAVGVGAVGRIAHRTYRRTERSSQTARRAATEESIPHEGGG